MIRFPVGKYFDIKMLLSRASARINSKSNQCVNARKYYLIVTTLIFGESFLARGCIFGRRTFLLVRGILQLCGSFALGLGFPLLCGR